MNRPARLPALLCLLWLCQASIAQVGGSSPARQLSLPDTRVTVMTLGPSAVFFEAFGHNAIIVQDPVSGFAASYNFGYFDFQQDHFLLNFVRGLMTYQLAALQPEPDIARYLNSSRRLMLQTLNLSDEQKRVLINHLEWHRQPANAAYSYDYFKQNCSTKVRDALDLALGGTLRQAANTGPTSATYRSSMQPYAAAVPWMHIGANLGLGHPVDHGLPLWDLLYLPDQLALLLADARNPALGNQPVVAQSRVLSEGQSPKGAWALTLAALGLGVAIAGVLIWRYGWARRSWALGSAMLGLILLALWFATDHWATAFNPTVAALSPLLAVWTFVPPRLARWLAALICLGMIAALLVSHGLVQPAALVIQLALMSIAWRRTEAKLKP